MAPRDKLEHYEATEAQDLTRLLRALRPPERALQVPLSVDLTIRAEIWKAQVRRQLSTLLSMARRDLVQVIRQALTDNPLLEAMARAEDEHTLSDQAHVPRLTVVADDLTDAAARYDSIWQACVPDGWDVHDLPSQASEAPRASERPSGPFEVLVPDVIAMKVGHNYQVRLNDEGMPRLRLSATYRHMIGEAQWGEPERAHDLDDKLRAAVWLIRNLEHRRQILLKVATSLVTCQRAFLDHGLVHVKPLALTAVADAIGLQVSTVGRVLANKYLATAHGIVALASFFPRGLESSGGETISPLTVKHRIEKLIAAEDSTKPLTDQHIVEILAAEHIKIARRTVTKYRCELNLPPANRRQQPDSAPLLDASEPVPDMQEVLAVRETRMRDLPMICQSPKMREVSRLIERVLKTTATVLIMGEPGTGKGLVARILHDQGSRRQGPFIAVSCAGIPETRLEAELFSHFERAAGGTLFIDGITEMSPTLQAKLLRVLQEGLVKRIESPETHPTQARIVAAATPELERLIGAGTFRQDLFYRLNVYPITLPPLRERQEDLRPLTMHFLRRFSQALSKEVRGISKEAMGWLERYPWPGNVRELEEVIEGGVARCQGPTLTAQDLTQAWREQSRQPGSSGDAFRLPPGGIDMCALEQELIGQALEQAQQNKSQAAKLLGLSRAQLRARMRGYGLE